MPADLVHLVRHGEVHNPDRVLYGRIAGFGLSERGHRMAEMAAASLAGRDITTLWASPLQRTRESAQPWADRFGLEPHLDERLIEPANRFEGLRVREALRTSPKYWPWVIAPWRPSWGEAFVSISKRMRAAVTDVVAQTNHGEAVIVSHQLPIWMVTRHTAGRPLAHDPRRRRCALSSITTFRLEGGKLIEVDYQEPAAELLGDAIDLGAV